MVWHKENNKIYPFVEVVVEIKKLEIN